MNYITFLQNKDIIEKCDNIIYATKAFKLNSIINACLRNKDNNAQYYIEFAKKYLEEDIDFEIKNDIIFIIEGKKRRRG